MTTTKSSIGWREWVHFVDFGDVAVKAKIDTGARTSALHAFGMEEVEVDGIRRVRFEIHPVQKRATPSVPVEAAIVDRRSVRNSGGIVEHRPVIETVVRLGEVTFPIELTLTRRDEMGFRMLLGRSAVRRRFLIDPGRSFLTNSTTPTTRSRS
ncbi:MAG: RimK/LysX family protein [Acidimicrobiia bacterium]